MLLQNELCNIKITADDTYTIHSADNRHYDLVHNPCKYKRGDFYKAFDIEIDRFSDKIRIALIGDFFSCCTDCAILEGDVLTVLQNHTITRISIYDGKQIMCKKLECIGSAFGIYSVESGYVVYGETEITMLDFQLNYKWSFSGRDIFVSGSGKKSFSISEKLIRLYDFEDNYYEVDFNGRLIR